MRLEIKTSADEIQSIFNRLASRKEANQVIKKALNRTVRQASKEILPQVREVYTVKRGTFKNSDIKVNGASMKTRMTASIRITGEPQSPKNNFQFKKNSPRKAVRVRILKSGGLKPIEIGAGKSSLKAFIATIENGSEGDSEKNSHTGIFQRVEGKYMNRGRITDKGYSSQNTYKPRRLKDGRMTKGRQSIKEIFTVSNPKMVENQKVYQPWREKTGSMLQENLREFVDQALGGKT